MCWLPQSAWEREREKERKKEKGDQQGREKQTGARRTLARQTGSLTLFHTTFQKCVSSARPGLVVGTHRLCPTERHRSPAPDPKPEGRIEDSLQSGAAAKEGPDPAKCRGDPPNMYKLSRLNTTQAIVRHQPCHKGKGPRVGAEPASSNDRPGRSVGWCPGQAVLGTDPLQSFSSRCFGQLHRKSCDCGPQEEPNTRVLKMTR